MNHSYESSTIVVEVWSQMNIGLVSLLPSSYHHLFNQKLSNHAIFPDKRNLGLVCSITKLLFLLNNEEIKIMLYRTNWYIIRGEKFAPLAAYNINN
jgi:aspartyl/asparaginyl beta-hydroxylase (cupin superfamily)